MTLWETIKASGISGFFITLFVLTLPVVAVLVLCKQRRYVAMFIVVATVGLAAGTLMAGGLRAWEFGFSVRSFLFVAFYVSLLMLPVLGICWLLYLIRAKKALRLKTLMILVLVVLVVGLLSSLLAELWCGLEEHHFKREVVSSGSQSFSRARWFPYGSCGLVYEDGEYAAHD